MEHRKVSEKILIKEYKKSKEFIGHPGESQISST